MPNLPSLPLSKEIRSEKNKQYIMTEYPNKGDTGLIGKLSLCVFYIWEKAYNKPWKYLSHVTYQFHESVSCCQ